MKTIVITGASDGIGFAVAKDMLQHGWRVIGVGHTARNCIRAQKALSALFPSASLVFLCGDLSRQEEVRRIAEEVHGLVEKEYGGRLEALVNNAGWVKGWYGTTGDGYEQQFALNHLAGFLLTNLLFPLLKKSRGKVIMTGSGSHKHVKIHWDDVMLSRHYNPLIAYKQSKLAGMLFAFELNRRYEHTGVRAYVVDPGLVRTDIGNKETGALVSFIWTLRKHHGVSPSVPSKTYAHLCTAEDSSNAALYYYLCEPRKFSTEVNEKNAKRLFAASERLCGVTYA